MPTIEIDFDVFKALTMRRETEATTYNDVIRKMLGLSNASGMHRISQSDKEPWTVGDTSFPSGSIFVARYKGKDISGIVRNGQLYISDEPFPTPSAAACHVTGHNVNGWRFWKCKLPNASEFVLIERLRGRAN